MYERYFGIYVGSWTGEQVGRGTRVLLGNGYMVTQDNLNSLKPGDLLFYGGGSAQHVEMYIGNNQQLGHGSGMGPTLKTTTAYKHSAGFYQARRYVDVDGSTPDFKAKGICTCTANDVRIRTAAWGTIIGSVNSGQQLEYDGTMDGDFYHVRVNGIVGYIHKDYVNMSGTGGSFTPKGTCTCTADGVRIRDAAWGNTLDYAYTGTTMEYDGTSDGEFVHVRVNGIIGYIHKDYVRY